MTTSTGTQVPPVTAGLGSPGAELPEEAFARQVDGLFTYCLSVLCDHDAALDALQSVRVMAMRHHERLRDPALMRPWLYSLARYACLVRLQGSAGVRQEPAGGRAARTDDELRQRRERLASLAWPEAAGTTPEQREALELAVRHGLAPHEVAAVLGLGAETAGALLAQAACEVERTRTALLVLKAADCPELAQLGAARPGNGQLLGPALRRELVQHVDDCPTCRGTAERAVAEGPWPGSSALQVGGTPPAALLPKVPAPPDALAAGPDEAGPTGSTAAGRRPRAVRHARQGAAGMRRRLGGRPEGGPADGGRSEAALFQPPRGASNAPDQAPVRREGASAGPRFDRRGFPLHRAEPTHLAAVLRSKAVTTTVLAAVLAAPAVSLWAAHRDGGGGDSAGAVSAVRVETPAAGHSGVQARPSDTTGAGQRAVPPVTATVVDPTDTSLAAVGETLPPGALSRKGVILPIPVTGAATPGGRLGTSKGAPAGRLTVEAEEYGSRTVVTLTNSGHTTIHWRAVTRAAWLRLSRDSGVLEPGRRITVIVTVDKDRVPRKRWTAQITLPPSQAVVTLEGSGRAAGGAGHRPTTPAAPPSRPGKDPGSPSGGSTPQSSPTNSPSPQSPSPAPAPTQPSTSPDVPPAAAPTSPDPAPRAGRHKAGGQQKGGQQNGGPQKGSRGKGGQHKGGRHAAKPRP